MHWTPVTERAWDLHTRRARMGVPSSLYAPGAYGGPLQPAPVVDGGPMLRRDKKIGPLSDRHLTVKTHVCEKSNSVGHVRHRTQGDLTLGRVAHQGQWSTGDPSFHLPELLARVRLGARPEVVVFRIQEFLVWNFKIENVATSTYQAIVGKDHP